MIVILTCGAPQVAELRTVLTALTRRRAAARAPRRRGRGGMPRSSPRRRTPPRCAALPGLALGDEDRVVTEPALTGARRREAARPNPLDDVLGAAGQHERDRRDELRRAVRIGDVEELIEQQIEVRRGILAVARPVRGEDAGSAPQHVDADAGVVGQRGQTGVRRGGTGLDQRVLGEGDAVLDGLGAVVADDLEVRPGRGDDRGELLHLVRVVGRQDDARGHRSPFAGRRDGVTRPAPRSGPRAAGRTRRRRARAARRARSCRTARPRPCPAPRRTGRGP